MLETPKPRLIFEYHRLGSLDQQSKCRQISRPEILQCLRQSLLALVDIHDEDMAHRDIKPENILLKCRDPWHVVLADFGLSKIGTKLLTVCGTCSYTAPEIYGDSGYTKLCDIWSLGVVIFEFAFGLPFREDHEKGMVWGKKLIRKLQALAPELLADFLLKFMLVLAPERRQSAESCLRAVDQLILFHSPFAPSSFPTYHRHYASFELRQNS